MRPQNPSAACTGSGNLYNHNTYQQLQPCRVVERFCTSCVHFRLTVMLCVMVRHLDLANEEVYPCATPDKLAAGSGGWR